MEKDILDAFLNGHLTDGYNYYGAHPSRKNGRMGTTFTVWAPNAWKVAVVGDFNQWQDHVNIMTNSTGNGIWSLFIEDAAEGDLYKYKVFANDGSIRYKADPYGFASELRPNTASVITNLESYSWTDQKWLKKRPTHNIDQAPINIYEIHLGSWKQTKNNKFLDYKEIASILIPYVKKMGYTHIELMPVSEHPLDASWGYQATGYYAITSRYGTPEDLMYMVNKCHEANIGVIFDWVPGHFCKDAQGLADFDGTMLYGRHDHPHWGTRRFDFSRGEVLSYLISNAMFFFDKYHVDGLRVDGVASMLDLNFGHSDLIHRNHLGETHDLHAIDFMKRLNTAVFGKYPGVIMSAEDSSAWPLVTYPVHEGGLGFNFKWDMGWMNDTLEYMALDPIYRKYDHDKITFSMMYAFSENFILPLSHDEVVHGKKSMVDKMSGSYDDKFKNLKLLQLYQMTRPGKKLNFMGNELAQFIEWRFYEEVEWHLLDYPMHDAHQTFVRDLNRLYLRERSLWANDKDWDGFRWIDADNRDQSVFIFERKSESENLIIILNFTPNHYDEFSFGVPEAGEYRTVLQTNDKRYLGPDNRSRKYIKTTPISRHHKENSLTIELQGLSGLILKKKTTRK